MNSKNSLKKRIFITANMAVILMILCVVILSVVGCSCNCDHASLAYTVTKEATCMEDGVQTHTCKDCGEVVGTSTIPKGAHAYERDEKNCEDATCTETGLEVLECKHCGDTIENVVATIAHRFEKNNAKSKDATCTTAGITVSACKTCNAEETEIVRALGHDWKVTDATSGLTAAACVARTCNRCDEENQATAAHTYSVTADTATCGAGGTKTYTCSGCSDHYTEASEAKGHTVNDWVNDDTFTPVPVSGETCLYLCHNKGTCSVCNEAVVQEFENTIHEYTLQVSVSATCSTVGAKRLTCVCGAVTGTVVSYYDEHHFEEVSAGKLACTDCTATRVVYTENSATLNKGDLAQEVELGSGAVIRLPDSVAGTVGESADLSADSLTKDDLDASTAGLDRVGADDTIYNLTLTSDGNAITEFAGKVNVKLPYTLQEGEDPTRVGIFYLGANGVELIEGVFTETNAATHEGYVSFETGHFSYYLVGLYTDSEICERFGHQYLVSQKAPTCTMGGYYITSCKRCGEFGERTFVPALGHTPVRQSTSVNPTCTANGHDDIVCSVCNHAYTVVTVATGHSFVVSEEVKATCENAGKRVETCETCGAKHTVTLAQLQHRLNSVVTAPTCTMGGYTTHTCMTCTGYSYQNSFVPALGHNWNVKEPTCSEGQTCLVCGAAGQPATNKHTMEGGTCKYCGYGCDHTDNLKETVAATCHEGGYSVYACTKCARERKSDYTKPAGHTYLSGFGVCSACGATNENLAASVKEMLSSLVADGYTVKLENLHVVSDYKSEYSDGSEGREDRDETTIDLYEVYLTNTKDGMQFYAKGAIVYQDDNDPTETGSIEMYGDGKYIYLITTENSAYNSLFTEKNVSRVDYEASMQEMIEEMMEEFGGGSVSGPSYDESTPLPDSNVDNSATPMSYKVVTEDGGVVEEEMPKTIGELIDWMYNMAWQNSYLAPWLTVLTEQQDEMYGIFGKVFFEAFKGEKTRDGVRYTLDVKKLQAYHNDMKTLKIDAFIDKYFGEGTVADTEAYLKGLENKKIYDLSTEILTYCDESGIPSDLVFEMINSMMSEETGEDFDIRDYIEGTYRNTTIGEIYTMILDAEEVPADERMAFADVIDHGFGMLSEKTVYELLISYERDRESAIPTIDGILAQEGFTLAMTVGADGKLVSIEVACDEFKIDNTDTYVYSQYEDEYGNVIVEITRTYTTKVQVDGQVSLLFTASIPATAGNTAKEFNALYEKMVAAITAGATGVQNNLFTVKEGVIYILVESEYYDDEDGWWKHELVEIPLDEIYGIDISKNCTDSYYVSIDAFADRYGYARFYFNEKTNTFSTETFHLWGTEYLGEIPAGTYRTYEEAPCQSNYGQFWQCACGDIIWDNHYKGHDTYDEVTLVPDATTCDNGVIVKSICYNCDKVVSTWTTSGHYRKNIVSREEIATPHSAETGKTYFITEVCACGLETDCSLEGGCEFNSSVWDSEHECYRYNCMYENCPVYKTYESENDLPTDTPCVYIDVTTYKVYSGDTLLFTGERKSSYISHDWTWSGNHYRKCNDCGLERYYETKDNALGKTIYELEWERKNGVYVYYHHRLYVYRDACHYDYYYSGEYGVEPAFRYSSENHRTQTVNVFEGSCTQPSAWYSECRDCDYTGSDIWWNWNHYPYYGYYGHSWVETEEGSEFAYVCNACGLYSNKAASHVSLEDLTDHPVQGKEDSIVIGYIGSYDRPIDSFSTLDIKIAFIPSDMHYSDDMTTTLPAATVIPEAMRHVWEEDDRYQNRYWWYYLSSYSGFGRFSITLESLMQSAEALIGQEGVTATTAEEFLATHDLAIVVQRYDYTPDNIGDSEEGAYSVIVLEDLMSYFE